MNKKILILLSDCYPYWVIYLAVTLPLLLGVAITGIPFALFFMLAAGIVTIFLIVYTAVRASQLRSSHIDILTRRNKEELRDFEYNFRKKFKHSFDEYFAEIRTELDGFNKSVKEQAESMKRKRNEDLEAENNEQLKDVVYKNDFVQQGDRLRQEIQNFYNEVDKSISKSLVKQDEKLDELKQISQEYKKQFKEVLLKKELKGFREKLYKDFEETIDDCKDKQENRMSELNKLTQETRKQLKKTFLKEDFEDFSEQFRDEIKKSIEDAIIELDKKLVNISKVVNKISQNKKGKETDYKGSNAPVKKRDNKTKKSVLAQKKTKIKTKGRSVKHKNESKLTRKSSKTTVKKRRL